MKKRITIFLCAALIGLTSVNTVAYADQGIMRSDKITYAADKKEWHYMQIGNVKYKRLYNITKGKYETGWIRM